MINLAPIRARNEERKNPQAHREGCFSSVAYDESAFGTCGCYEVLAEVAPDDIDALLAVVDKLNEMTPGRWWRVRKPDGRLWCETSSEEEARNASTETGWPLERLFVSDNAEWRLV